MALTKNDLDKYKEDVVEAINGRFDYMSEHFATREDLINAKSEILNTLDT